MSYNHDASDLEALRRLVDEYGDSDRPWSWRGIPLSTMTSHQLQVLCSMLLDRMEADDDTRDWSDWSD
jgi:hypothetical protein